MEHRHHGIHEAGGAWLEGSALHGWCPILHEGVHAFLPPCIQLGCTRHRLEEPGRGRGGVRRQVHPLGPPSPLPVGCRVPHGLQVPPGNHPLPPGISLRDAGLIRPFMSMKGHQEGATPPRDACLMWLNTGRKGLRPEEHPNMRTHGRRPMLVLHPRRLPLHQDVLGDGYAHHPLPTPLCRLWASR